MNMAIVRPPLHPTCASKLTKILDESSRDVRTGWSRSIENRRSKSRHLKKPSVFHRTTLISGQRPVPKPELGWVLIRVKAFGLNRSELFTRQGHSPGIKFPRILGIEATGLVEEAPGGEFQKGDVVATAMGVLRNKDLFKHV